MTAAASLTSYLDVAQVTLYAFWIFFAGLIFYLRREDRREGYPLEDPLPVGRAEQERFMLMPEPKTFLTREGHTYTVPRRAPDLRPIAAVPAARWPGAPLQPTGNPMVDGVGPAAWAERRDEPEMTLDGFPLIVPMRVATQTFIEPRDVDPRGMPVRAADRRVAGHVRELWVDQSEPQIRYLEVEIAGGAAPKAVLVPMTLARVNAALRQIEVSSVLASQFADAPVPKNPDIVTKLEEDKICAYFASGHLYATPARLGPVL